MKIINRLIPPQVRPWILAFIALCVIAFLAPAHLQGKAYPTQDPTWSMLCLGNLPEPNTLVEYKYAACPLGLGTVEGVYPIKSFREGYNDRLFTDYVTAPDQFGGYAFTAREAIGIYPDDQTHTPTLAVYWLKDEGKFWMVAENAIELYTPDSEHLTTCFGKTDRVVCISIFQSNNERLTYLPEYFHWHAFMWVAWFPRK